jgi:RNA polymerase sigma-70 factor (ECF subfamily)
MKERRHHPRRDVLTEAEQHRVERVFTEHRRFIENVARQHAFLPDDVPDIVQAVGMKVCQSLNGFRGDSELKTWLYRVTVNTSRDHYHRERRQLRAAEAIALVTYEGEAVVNPDEEVLAGERMDAVEEAMIHLRPMYRSAIHQVMRNHAGQRPVPEDGDTKEATRKTRLFRARRQLRDILEDDPRFDS